VVIEIKVVEVGIIIEGCVALQRCGRSWCTVTTVRVTGSQAAFRSAV
jgi:hypothetical protein